LSIKEHHDEGDEGLSVHQIIVSIPCRLPDVKHDTAADVKHSLWRHDTAGSDEANVRHIVNMARQMIDFGMETESDEWFGHTVSIFEAFSMKIDRIREEFSNLNLYRVIFVSSPDRCSELRSLGYKGQLVLVTSPEDRAGPIGCDYTVELPYTLDAMDSFFRSIALHQTLSRKPNLLSALDRVGMALRPHQRIPIVSWTMYALQQLNQVHFSALLSSALSSASFLSAAPVPPPSSSSAAKYPATSAYTPITPGSGVDPSKAAGIDEIDYEYLTNNKIVTSTDIQETMHIADNYLDDTGRPKLDSAWLSKSLEASVKYLF